MIFAEAHKKNLKILKDKAALEENIYCVIYGVESQSYSADAAMFMADADKVPIVLSNSVQLFVLSRLSHI
jgi:hypothetical protein